MRSAQPLLTQLKAFHNAEFKDNQTMKSDFFPEEEMGEVATISNNR